MADTNSVSLLALIVALLALFIALGQLAQQIFGTADGYRRCQSSVIGPWAKYTKLRWRWSQFRFETKFATPDIRLSNAELGEGYHDLFAQHSHVIGGKVLVQQSAVSWTELLSELHVKERWKTQVTRGSERWEQRCVTKKIDRSWDLMPPDMVLPLASSRLGDIVVLAHRLGMRWLDVGHKELLAEGSGQVLSSMELRGIGLVLKYDRVGKTVLYDEFIPSVAVDKLRCGILPSAFQPCFDDFRKDLRLIGDDRQPSLLLNYMTWVTYEAGGLLGHYRASPQNLMRRFAHSINDWISMNIDFLPLPNWPYRRIVWPIAMDKVRSIFMSRQSRTMIVEELQRLAEAGDAGARLVIERTDPRFQRLKKDLPSLLEDVMEACHQLYYKPDAPLDSSKVQMIREVYNQTTSVFQSLASHATGKGIKSRNPYRVLVDSHLSISVESTNEAYDQRNSFEPSDSMDHIPRHSLFRYKLLQLCIQRRATVAEHFNRVGGNAAMSLDSAQVEGLWWVLLLRSCCWWASVEVYTSHENFKALLERNESLNIRILD